MSQHHLRTKHTSKSAAIRKSIEARLPLPCIEPRCLFPGQPVRKGDKWHVAHIVPAAQGGQTTLRNCGPAHAACNLQSGGRLGAAVTNIKRTTAQGRRKWV